MVPGAPFASVRFQAPDVMLDLPEPGAVAWVDDPLVLDAIRINSVSMNFDQTGPAMLTITADVLAGTAAAWRS
jgi:hypothetical protein